MKETRVNYMIIPYRLQMMAIDVHREWNLHPDMKMTNAMMKAAVVVFVVLVGPHFFIEQSANLARGNRADDMIAYVLYG